MAEKSTFAGMGRREHNEFGRTKPPKSDKLVLSTASSQEMSALITPKKKNALMKN